MLGESLRAWCSFPLHGLLCCDRAGVGLVVRFGDRAGVFFWRSSNGSLP
jgi:hypothetical protein